MSNHESNDSVISHHSVSDLKPQTYSNLGRKAKSDAIKRILNKKKGKKSKRTEKESSI